MAPKRKLVYSGEAARNVRRAAAASQQAAWRASHPQPMKVSLQRQVRALIAGKQKDAADILRTSNAAFVLATPQISCLSSSTDFAVAPSGTGLMVCDSDAATINNVRIKGRVWAPMVSGGAAATFAAARPPRLRMLVVFFYKPAINADASGTLPPLTEVLGTSPTVDSLPITATANAGRFAILSDRTLQPGTNFVLNGVSQNTNANSIITVDYTVKVNKKCDLSEPATSAIPGGHFDSDVKNGLVTRGLLMLYQIADWDVGSTAVWDIRSRLVTRLNYTA